MDAAGSRAGETVGALVGSLAVGVAAAAGATVSAPVAGAVVLGASFLGGLFGADGATAAWNVWKNHDDASRLSLMEKYVELFFGPNQLLTDLPDILLAQEGASELIHASLSPSDLADRARDDIAWRYALQELHPFVLTGIDYSALNPNGALDLYDPDGNPQGMTPEYLALRAQMLHWRLQYDQRGQDLNETFYAESTPGNWDFIDLRLKNFAEAPDLTLKINGTDTTLYDHQVVFGSERGEELEGSGDTDWLFGGGGDDTLVGGADGGELYGGAGRDTLWGDAGDDRLDGGAEADEFIGSGGRDTLTGGTGADRFRFWSATLKEAGNASRITDASAEDRIWIDDAPLASLTLAKTSASTWQSADGGLLFTWTGGDLVIQSVHHGLPGLGQLVVNHFANGLLGLTLPQPDPIPGTDGADTLAGTAQDDLLLGGLGNDTLRAGDGDDILDGGADDDALYAGHGDDVLLGGAGNDRLYGERGSDTVRGGPGHDTLYDVAGDETYYFALGDGVDTLFDGAGEDTLIFEGIDYTDLRFAQTGPSGRDLEISVLGTDDRITVTDWFLNANRQIEHLEAGGATLAAAQVAGLAGALAEYPGVAPPDEVFGQYWIV